MTEQIIIIVTIISFLIIGFLIKKGKINTIGEFSINRDKLKWFPIAAGISMTYAGGAALLNMASLGYSFGWYPMVDPLALFGGIMIVIVFIKKYRKDKGVTISDLLSKTDNKLAILIGLITTFVFVLILSAQFVALSKVLIPYFPNTNPILLTLIPSTLVFSYVFLGGFSSVTKTDILQLLFVAIFLILPVLYFVATSQTTEVIENNHQFATMPLNLIILLSISLIFLPISQDVNIRVKSAKSELEAKKGLIFGVIFYGLIILTATYIGISLGESGIEIGDTEQAYSLFFKNYFPKFGVIAILAALAAIISTLDSYSLNSITSLSNDILSKVGVFKNKSQKQLINIAGGIVFILAISIALFFNQILVLVLTALLIYVSVLIPIILGKKLGVKDNYILYSSIILIIGIIIIEIFKIEIEPKAIIYPCIGIVLMLIAKLFIKTTK